MSETQIAKAKDALDNIARAHGYKLTGVELSEAVRAVLRAALSDQVVVPKEPTKEMLDNAFVNGPLPMTGLDGSEQAKRERATVAEIYRAMIEAAPASTAGEV